MPPTKPVLAWLDLEMTGLDPDTCAIVQLAIIVTDTDLRPLAQPLELTIWQPESVLERMVPFVRQMHEKSGLLAQVRQSEVDVAEAEQEAMRYLVAHAPYRTARLCGNSIGQDRKFLCRYMPLFESYLHYRQIDVSSLKELGRWWNNHTFVKADGPQHTALFDVRQSIAELEHYRTHLWRGPDAEDGTGTA
jgi:oligoribonuclease